MPRRDLRHTTSSFYNNAQVGRFGALKTIQVTFIDDGSFQYCPYEIHGTHCAHLHSYQDDTSSMETRSNNPGTGRILGIAISYVGRRVERCLGTIAHRFGCGPIAVYLELSRIEDDYELWLYSAGIKMLPYATKVRSSYLCRRLLEYTW